MKYLSTFEVAEKWGISPRRVRILCNNDRIPGAQRELNAAPAIHNAMLDYIRRLNPSFDAKNLDCIIRLDEVKKGENKGQHEFIADSRVQNPEQIYIAKETHEEIHTALQMIEEREKAYLLYRFGFEDDVLHHVVVPLDKKSLYMRLHHKIIGGVDMNEINTLVNSVIKYLAQCEKNENTNKEYNLFKVLQVDAKEVVMCRFLADLLSPCGDHGCGTVFLKSFLQLVCNIPISDELIKNTTVTKEYLIPGSERRIDIVIQNRNMFLPIEVKIYAGEQQSQCYDYYDYARKIDPNTKVLYLTRFGTPPSDYSLTSSSTPTLKLDHDNIIKISFADDILNWLTDILSQITGAVKQAITQYIEAIAEFTDKSRREKQVKTVEIITQSKEAFAAALQIEKSATKAKLDVMTALFREFENQMEPIAKKYGLERITEVSFTWSDYKDKATTDFYKRYSTYPGINYVVRNAHFSDENVQLWLRIEIEHALFAGFCLFNSGKDSKGNIGYKQDTQSEALKAEAAKFVEVPPINGKNWWILWKYLPSAIDERKNSDDVPNFKEMNEVAVALVDETYRKDFVRKSVAVIESNLLKLLKV